MPVSAFLGLLDIAEPNISLSNCKLAHLQQQDIAQRQQNQYSGCECTVAGAEASAAQSNQGGGKPVPNKIPLTDPDLLEQMNEVLLGCCVCLLR